MLIILLYSIKYDEENWKVSQKSRVKTNQNDDETDEHSTFILKKQATLFYHSLLIQVKVRRWLG